MALHANTWQYPDDSNNRFYSKISTLPYYSKVSLFSLSTRQLGDSCFNFLWDIAYAQFSVNRKKIIRYDLDQFWSILPSLELLPLNL